MPNHPVFNVNKPGKLRRVLNAFSIFKGFFHNIKLLTGRDLLKNLTGILMRLRQDQIAISADIESMFTQVFVKLQDQPYLRILWKDDKHKPITYQFIRHIYGSTESPSVACYDTWLCAKDLQTMFSRGGYNLTQWTFNTEDSLRTINKNDIGNSDSLTSVEPPLERDRMEARQRRTSCGSQKNQSVDKEDLTQRKLLKLVSSIFDPLGQTMPMKNATMPPSEITSSCLDYSTSVGQIPQCGHLEGSQRMDWLTNATN